MSDAELLAILLRTGSKGKNVLEVASEIIQDSGSLSLLAAKDYNYLTKFQGVGEDKAVILGAALEVGRRISKEKKYISDSVFKSPDQIAKYFIEELRDEIVEKFIIILLNSHNKIIRYITVSQGSLNASIVHPREVFRKAIENSANSIILLHNHPSGNTEPSEQDIQLTKRLTGVGKIVGIEVIDHIIIAGNRYTSFVEKNIFL